MKLKLKVHPLFVLYGAYAAVCGRLFSFLSVTAVALLHECGHSLYAASVGYRLDRICLMPYGAVVSGEPQTLRKREEILLCLAGPFTNALTVLFFVSLWWFFPETYAFTDTIMQASLAMLVVNLLPAYPLDGGRVAKCVLSKLFSPRAAHIILRVTNLSIAAGMVALFIISKFNITFLFFALFLVCSALEKSPPAVHINFASRAALRRGVEVKTVIVGDELTVKDAVRLLDDKRYLTVRRESDGKEITQDELCDVMAQKSIYDNVFD